MSFGTSEILLLLVGGPLLFLIFGSLLKAACDLCSVEPPPHLVRCLVIALVLAAIVAPLGYVAYLIGKAIGSSETIIVLVSLLVFLPLCAAISTAIFIPSLRVRPLKGARIWLVHTLINMVVGAVLGMLIIGGWTTVDSIRRLF